MKTKRMVLVVLMYALMTVPAYCEDYMVTAGGLFTDPLGFIYRITTQTPFEVEKLKDGSGAFITPFQDNTVKAWRDYVFVMGRYTDDTVTVLKTGSVQADPVANYSVGIEDPFGNEDLTSPQSSSNPQDLLILDENIAYMVFNGSSDLLKLNPLTGERLRRIDLSSFNEGTDGLPECNKMILKGSKLYVKCNRQDQDQNWTASNGAVAVIDITTDAVVGRIDMQGRNPADMVYVPSTNQLLLPFSAEFGEIEGAGLEAIDLNTETSLGIRRTAVQMGGKGAQIVIRGTKSYALLFNDTVEWPYPYFVRTFDPNTYDVGTEDIFRANHFLPDMALDRGDHLYVVDRADANPGIRIFDTTTDREAGFVPTDLPMYSITFAEANPFIGGSSSGASVVETIDTAEVDGFNLLLNQRVAGGISGRIYVSVEFPTVSGLENLLFFRPSDDQVPTETGSYAVLAATDSGFLPGTEDFFFYEGPLNTVSPDLQFFIGGGLKGLAGETIIFKSWLLKDGSAFSADNLEVIQTVEISFN